MKHAAVIFLALSLLPPAHAAVGGEPDNADLSDVRDFLFLAPGRPLFIRMHIQVDERGFREQPDVLAERLFAALDTDEDGALNEEEAQQIPPRNRFREARQSTPITFAELDRDSDTRVTPEELQHFVRQNVGDPLDIKREPGSRKFEAELFGQLDAEDDGVITAEEFHSTRSRFAKYDVDDDETLSKLEFASLLPPDSADTANVGSLLIALDNSRWQSDVALKLLKIYGETKAKQGKGPRTLSREQLDIDEQTFAKLDGNGDGTLTLAELTPLVQDPTPHIELLAELSTRRQRATVTPMSSSKGVEFRPGRNGRLTLLVSGMEILIDSERRGVTARDESKLFRLRFLQYDADKNGYIDESEFGGLQLTGAEFKAVDRDGDGMIQVKEVAQYVEQRMSLARNLIGLTVAMDGKSLFDMLDVNIDRRLSPRELREAMVHLAEWDADGDQRLALTEIPSKYKLTFSIGQSLLFPGGEMQAMDQEMEARRPEADSSAPVWFQKMDRNRDGDISRREFLGPPQAFQKLDRDDDGLIDVDEAQAAEQKTGE